VSSAAKRGGNETRQPLDLGVRRAAAVWMPRIATPTPALCTVWLAGAGAGAGADDHGAMMSPSDSSTL